MRVAVTGASGFVGGAVCAEAVRRGWETYGFSRRPVAGVDWRYWDITSGPLADPPEVDVVVHAAAAVTDWGRADRVWRANVTGTRDVALTFPGTRFVHVSSASVYDPFVPTVLATEIEAPVHRYLTPYGASKAEAERLLSARPDTVVLRPHAVYGPGDPTLLPRLRAAVRDGTLWMAGDGSAPQSLTSIRNLTNAVLAACGSSATGVFNIADAAPVRVDTAIRGLFAALGLPGPRLRRLPTAVATPLAVTVEALYRLVRSPRPPRLTRYAISHLAVERTLDISAAKAHLGYVPTETDLSAARLW